MEKSNAEKVKEFAECRGKECARVPVPLSRERVKFLLKMLTSELVELAQTVADSPHEALCLVMHAVAEADNFKPDYKPPETALGKLAEQADALVDIWYYSLDLAAIHGVNLSRVFDLVHAANMNKCWSDGKFHVREDGKIIKPPDWQEPDVVGEMIRQIEDGAWPERD